MGCRPSRNSLSRVADSTCEYNRCYMKEFDQARRKQKKSARENRKRNLPTYNNFSSTSKVYDRTSGTSKITVRLSTDGSMLEIEQFDVDFRNAELSEVVEDPDDDSGLFMKKSPSELKAIHNGRKPYGRCDSAPLLMTDSYEHTHRSHHKESSCGFTSCCTQNLSDSRTVSDEYKIRSDSIAEIQNDARMVIEHDCEVHRDYERNKRHVTGDARCDTLSDTQPPNCISKDEYASDCFENTNVTKVSVGTETMCGQSNVCQKTSITVKKSSLEQQFAEANKKTMRDSQSYSVCSSFKPVYTNDKVLPENGTRLNCKRCQSMPCGKHSVFKDSNLESSETVVGKSEILLSSTLGIATAHCHVNTYNDNPSIGAAENKPMNLSDSIGENVRGQSDITCDSTTSCTNCNVAMYTGCDRIESNNAYQSYQPEICGSQYGIKAPSTDVGVYYCCCFAKSKNNEFIDGQSTLISKFLGARSTIGHQLDDPNNKSRTAPNCVVNEHDIINIEQKSVTGELTCPECGKIYLHPVMFAEQTPESVDGTLIDNKSLIASQNDGQVSIANCYLKNGELSQVTASINDSIRHGNIDRLSERTRFGEMTNTCRPYVPNRTVPSGSDSMNKAKFTQKSIMTSSEVTKYISTEQFKINNCIRCVHSENETLNADNLKSVAMVTNGIPQVVLADNVCPCKVITYDKESLRTDECGDDRIHDVRHTTERATLPNSCSCRKRVVSIGARELQTITCSDAVTDQLVKERKRPIDIEEENRCLDMFPFSEYESFVVRDNRRNTEADSYETYKNTTHPLLGMNNEETLSSDDNTGSDDDGDFDDSSDACLDEYVDALETTYV